MKKINTRILPGLILLMLIMGVLSCTPKPELRAVIITGQNNHSIQNSTTALISILESADIFKVYMRTTLRQRRDTSRFITDFTPFDVVVLNYNGDAWPEETRNNFISYVENGGGVVVVHAASSAFPDWKEYNEIVGLSGWEEGDETAGSHGPQQEFMIETHRPDHPIMKGLPAKWLHARDELYQEFRGPAKNMEILATERNEPALFTVKYGSGRIFHTILGHAAKGDQFFPAMECAGFITTLQRGAEWAATGKVSQRVPDGFPDETKSVRWEYFEPMDFDIISERIQEYEIGKTNNCFVALRDLVADNSDNKARMDEYHDMILDILDSRSASKEGKKILLREFSWMATDAYTPVYEKLSMDPDLKDDALFALERMGY